MKKGSVAMKRAASPDGIRVSAVAPDEQEESHECRRDPVAPRGTLGPPDRRPGVEDHPRDEKPDPRHHERRDGLDGKPDTEVRGSPDHVHGEEGREETEAILAHAAKDPHLKRA
jgi:hypothetical protein